MNSSEKKRVVLAGGSGFLGKALAERFLARGYEVIVLTRAPSERSHDAKEIAWDAKSLGDWTKFMDGAEVVINLTGKSVDCRYNDANRKAIIASRVADGNMSRGFMKKIFARWSNGSLPKTI